MKSRQYNQGLKSVAIWGYWESAAVHGPGEGDPFFETVDGKHRVFIHYTPLAEAQRTDS